MNKKRKLELKAAILSIVVGFMMTLFWGCILFLGAMLSRFLTPLMSIYIVLTLTAVAMIVIGILLCIKTNLEGNIGKTKPLVITLLIFASISILLSTTIILLIYDSTTINTATITIFTYIAVTCIIAISVIIIAAISLATKNDIDQRNNSMNN